MTTFGVLGLAIGLGGIIAVGCTRPNASHCGNQSGDLTCEQRGGNTPYCDKCEIINDGCVTDPVTEPECIFGMGGGSVGSSASGSGSDGPGSGTADSSSGGPVCGNGVIEDGEACDGDALPDGVTCASEELGEGLPACALNCSDIIFAVCPGYTDCGNDALDADEECDNENLNDKTCDDFPNLTGRGLACSECVFNISACVACQENEQSCDGGEACCEARAECKQTVLMGKRCCIPGALGVCA